MKKVILNNAINTATNMRLDGDKESKTTVAEATNWVTGNIAGLMSIGKGAEGDIYFDTPILIHWAQTADNLDKVIRDKDLKDDDEVTVTYDVETDTWLFA